MKKARRSAPFLFIAIARGAVLPATTATATTTTAAASGLWLGFIDAQCAAHEVLLVESVDCGVRFCLVRHVNEAEAFGVASEFVHDYAGRSNGPVFREEFLEVLIASLVRQVSYVDIHLDISLS